MPGRNVLGTRWSSLNLLSGLIAWWILECQKIPNHTNFHFRITSHRLHYMNTPKVILLGLRGLPHLQRYIWRILRFQLTGRVTEFSQGDLQLKQKFPWCMAKVQDYGLEVSEFKLQSRFYVHLRTKNPRERYKSLYPLHHHCCSLESNHP